MTCSFSCILDKVSDLCPFSYLDVGLSVCVCDVEHILFQFSFYVARFGLRSFCNCLHLCPISWPYVKAGSAHEWNSIPVSSSLLSNGISLFLSYIMLPFLPSFIFGSPYLGSFLLDQTAVPYVRQRYDGVQSNVISVTRRVGWVCVSNLQKKRYVAHDWPLV